MRYHLISSSASTLSRHTARYHPQRGTPSGDTTWYHPQRYTLSGDTARYHPQQDTSLWEYRSLSSSMGTHHGSTDRHYPQLDTQLGGIRVHHVFNFVFIMMLMMVFFGGDACMVCWRCSAYRINLTTLIFNILTHDSCTTRMSLNINFNTLTHHIVFDRSDSITKIMIITGGERSRRRLPFISPSLCQLICDHASPVRLSQLSWLIFRGLGFERHFRHPR